MVICTGQYQAEPATVSMFPFWTSLRNSYFSFFVYKCEVNWEMCPVQFIGLKLNGQGHTMIVKKSFMINELMPIFYQQICH
jgi:hypothetical protein